MKVPVTLEQIRPSKKPSTMLGFLLCAVITVAVAFTIWQVCAPRGSWGKLKTEHMLAAIGLAGAVSGWMATGWINLRNSIRQHTITTLLQTRLSATYMGYADELSKHYSAYETRRKTNPAMREEPTDKVNIQALRYILNYFEFIAIGIKRGDLDEDMLRDSLRSILMKNVEMSRPWISALRVENKKYYSHVLWLHDKWVYELKCEP